MLCSREPGEGVRLRSGFTLVELIAVIGIIAVLVAMFFVVNRSLPARAEGPQCMANMRGIHTALAAYIQDRGQWPQEPENIEDNQHAMEDWWLAEMKPYGIGLESWQCPSVKRLVTSKRKDGRPKLHYTPSMFDAHPSTPYRWSTQPWLIEIGNMHGQGAFICFPDGSIRPMDEIVGR
ncbi:MAG: type II secretion system protein [Terrimicrobiaceae bacterium]|nr:type II secretion system protein [Terrimicrobiaceae bacterium]